MKGKLIYAVDLKWKAAATASNDDNNNCSNNGNDNIGSNSNNTNIDNNNSTCAATSTITTRPPEDIYAVDAITGEIVDSWFLRRTAVGDDVSKYYGFANALSNFNNDTSNTAVTIATSDFKNAQANSSS